MNHFEEGLQVLRIAAEKGNRPAHAVLEELNFRETRIAALHELNSELNGALRDLRQMIAERGELQRPEYKATLSHVGSDT